MKASASEAAGGSVANIKDMTGGALLVVGGAAVVIAAQGYGIGTLTEMGAGYFPALIGAVLFGIGVLMLAQSALKHFSLKREPEPFSTADFRIAPVSPVARVELIGRMRGMLCIMTGLVSFIVLGAYGGLLPASFSVVFISALGDRENTWRSALLIALTMTAICVVVFWWALQLQMPLFRFID
jgi:hypothetical protein